MVGGYHGDDDACAVATTTRLAKKLQPLDVMDRARETEFIKNVLVNIFPRRRTICSSGTSSVSLLSHRYFK